MAQIATPNAATTDRHATLHAALGESLGHPDHIIGIVVIRIQNTGAEVDDLVTGAELFHQLLFLAEAT